MRPITDETILLRDAIKEVLDKANEPLSPDAIAEHSAVFGLGLPKARVSRELRAMYEVQKKPWPLLRIPSSSPGRSQWDYFNPNVVPLVARGPDRRQEPDPMPVNSVNPPAFEFNPVEFAAEPPAAPQGDASVAVPAGVKSITLTVSGVTVRIELT